MECILLFFDQKENCRLLKDLLAEHYSIISGEDESSLEQSFDICIADGLALKRYQPQLKVKRKREEPIFLPFMLLTSRQDIGLITDDLQNTVDDAIVTPIEKQELLVKIKTLLRSRQLSLQLNAANEQLRELNTLKTRFVAIAAHDLRNPLNVIAGYARLLESHSDKFSEEQRSQMLRHINSSVRKMNNLLEDILVIGRSEEGKLKYNPAPMNLEQFYRELILDFQSSFGDQHQIQFHGSFFQEELVCLDQKLLQHICTNLLSNAIKYSYPGSTVIFEVVCQAQEVILIVKNEGIGIPLEKQQRLFEPYYRASNVGKIPGTGLGLSIVKECVDLHKGTITLDSRVGEGATFTVKLPVG
ncbi:HAMP domain-containing histidine kinase [Mastigocladus laminosus UU774]|nr:HAMP domain-containing histidine kinase [Mastigocladus laminosus UU774]